MSAITTVVGAFVLALLVATLFWGGAGLAIALPVAFVVLVVAFGMDVHRRRTSMSLMDDQRERAKEVEFTERDRETLYSSD
jgi:fatty acid desaturase